MKTGVSYQLNLNYTYDKQSQLLYTNNIYFMFVGSFAHVHSKDEVLESVLEYIAILARPLVLQAEKHPVTWSHTFMDISVSVKIRIRIL